MYTYRATITNVYDGDTITADLDLGFYSHMKKVKLRLWGLNAPEVRGESRAAGLAARDWLRERVKGADIIVVTFKDKQGKYGRWLATLIDNANPEGPTINEEMIAAGHAVEKHY